MYYRILNETDFIKCLSERRGAFSYNRKQKFGGIGYRPSIKKHQIKHHLLKILNHLKKD